MDPFDRDGLSLDRLRTFLRVVDAGGISRAAPGQLVRQSQMSRQIRELEAFFGRALVERRGRGLTVTAVGRQLADVVRSALQGLRDVATDAGGAAISFSLGAGDSLLHACVLPRIGEFATASTVVVSLTALAGADVVTRLGDGRLDFGIVTRVRSAAHRRGVRHGRDAPLPRVARPPGANAAPRGQACTRPRRRAAHALTGPIARRARDARMATTASENAQRGVATGVWLSTDRRPSLAALSLKIP
jgi:DNA-binding transcriptional LysR family regulator